MAKNSYLKENAAKNILILIILVIAVGFFGLKIHKAILTYAATAGDSDWTKRLGGMGGDSVYSITTDTNNNVIVTGAINGTVDINGDGDTDDANEIPSITYGGGDALISVFNSSGTLVWSKRMGGTGTDWGQTITTDTNNRVIVTGIATSTADLNGDNDTGDPNEVLTGTYGNRDIFISVFDSSGASQWSKRLGGTGTDYGYGITSDTSDRVIVTGIVTGAADLNGDGTINISDVNETPSGTYGGIDAFISVFDSSGTFQWSKRLGGMYTDYGYGITTGTNNRVIVIANATGIADLNGNGTIDISDANETPSGTYGGFDPFISVFDSFGDFLWSERLGGTGSDWGDSVITDTNNRVIVTGQVAGTADLNGDGNTSGPNEDISSYVSYSGQDAFISVFNSSGAFQWSERMGGMGADGVEGLTVDTNNKVIVSGQINGAADLNGDDDTIDTNEPPTAIYSGQDAFISVFNSSGAFQWSKRLGGMNTDYGNSIAADTSNNVIIDGAVNGIADLNGNGDISDANETPSAIHGLNDIYISKFVILPTVSAGAALSITTTSATINGSIDSIGVVAVTARGFEWGTNTSYGTTVSESGSYGTGAFSANLTGLTCGTTYHFRSFATNSQGTGYSSDQSFTTSACGCGLPPGIATTKIFTTIGAGAWTAPTGVTCVLAETWAGGGGGGMPGWGGESSGGGGAGGGFASAIVTVVPGNSYDYYVGVGGSWLGTAGQDSWFINSGTVLSKGGGAGGVGSSGAAGETTTGAIGEVIYDGGNGAAGVNASYSGAGGGGAGSAGNGGVAMTSTAGSGGSPDGGTGGAGKTGSGSGNAGSAPGGGGGGGKKVDYSPSYAFGGFGGRGQIRLTYALPTSWAWNSNIGWISFDSANCDSDGNGFIDTDAMVPGCGGVDNLTIQVFSYGISVDPATGNFSGYAWSNSVGWISFNRSDTGDPPGEPYQSGTILAHYNKGNNQVEGWARILSFKPLGEDNGNGWIKFNGNKQDGPPWESGVTINSATGDFSGWAWNANNDGSGIGWISFNCSNESPPCDKSNYKVIININSINSPPTAIDLTAPNWSYAQASADGALHANLKFDFVDTDAGSYGSTYQIIITKADDTPVLDTGECTAYAPPPSNCKLDNSNCMKNELTGGCVNPGNCGCTYPLAAELEYGTAYKWSVQVWDNFDVASAITTYDTNPDFPLEADDGVVPTFTTYKHKFPLVSAIYFPLEPSRGEKVKFTDTSKRFFSVDHEPYNPETPVDCTSATCDWLWTLPPGADATIDDPATSTPTITFNDISGNSVILRVTDETDTGTIPYYSEKIINVNVNAKLPKWREVKPE